MKVKFFFLSLNFAIKVRLVLIKIATSYLVRLTVKFQNYPLRSGEVADSLVRLRNYTR